MQCLLKLDGTEVVDILLTITLHLTPKNFKVAEDDVSTDRTGVWPVGQMLVPHHKGDPAQPYG